MAALIAFFLDFFCANEGIIVSACVPLYRSSNCALIADGFFDPASVEKIDAAVRVTDDEMRVWSYGKMRTSDDSVDLIPDYRMDANFRGRQANLWFPTNFFTWALLVTVSTSVYWWQAAGRSGWLCSCLTARKSSESDESESVKQNMMSELLWGSICGEWEWCMKQQIQIQKMINVWSNFFVRFQKMTSFRIYSDFNSSTDDQC